LEIFFIAVTIGFVGLHLYLHHGLTKSIQLDNNLSEDLPSVSVIVAGRNEERNIRNCINSLSALAYPKGRLEIILVNDKSNDRTYELMKEATKDKPEFHVIHSGEAEHTNLRGKANAIDTAIGICRGEIIFMTDADCAVPSSWIINTVRYFKPDVAMVCGFTLMKDSDSVFSRLQCLDWIYLLSLASSSCGVNKIMSCIGNNLAFKKEAYNSVGGYSAIDFSVTEDLALMRKINDLKGKRIVFPVSLESLVITEPCADLRELSSQKRRWFRGGVGINMLGYITGFELYTANLLIAFGLFFVEFKLWSLLTVLIVLSQILLMSRTSLRLKKNGLFTLYPLFVAYFAAYGLLLPLSFIFGKNIKWKGRKF
jgi:cellulose synthase/poly-beta-1,6-N-acetylglucosamine synthase-like glycosyltransferase